MPISASNEFSIIGLGKIGGVLAAQALEKGAPETKTLVGIGSGLPSSFPRLLTCSGGGPGDLSMHPSSRIKRPALEIGDFLLLLVSPLRWTGRIDGAPFLICKWEQWSRGGWCWSGRGRGSGRGGRCLRRCPRFWRCRNRHLHAAVTVIDKDSEDDCEQDCRSKRVQHGASTEHDRAANRVDDEHDNGGDENGLEPGIF
jgi:hypothetical protein